MNKVFLLGNLGNEIELKYTPSATAVANFNIATSKKVKDKHETTWHRVTVWGKTAENMAQFVKKGEKVFVEGEIVHRKYTDKHDNEKQITEINASVVKWFSKKEDNNNDDGMGF